MAEQTMFPGVGCSTKCGWNGLCAGECSPNEIALRSYEAGEAMPPMTQEQREWCIDEAARSAEGSYRREHLKDMNDQEIAHAVLGAWADYCRSQGVL